MAAVWTDVVAAVVEAVQALGLYYTPAGGTPASLPPGQVVARKFPTDRGLVALPLVIVALGPEDRYDEGDFGDTVVWYPVLVVTEFASNQDVTINDDELRWRQQIVDLGQEFERTIRGNVSSAEVSQCQIDLHPVIDHTAFAANVDLLPVLLSFRTARARTR
jgi:hypothetical protein